MNRNLIRMAVEVIGRASRERPADRELRETLKARRELSRRDAGEISRCVFSYYRWQGWLDGSQSLGQQVERASALAAKFAASPESFPDDELIRRVLPEWTHQEIELTSAVARALQAEPKVWLRVRPGQGRAVARVLGDCKAYGAGRLEDTLEYGGHEDLLRTPEFHSGQFELQDLSSQAVGLVCDPQPGQTWWDACAGEGGKLLHLADLMQNKGLIWASDRAAWRLAKLKRRAARARIFNYRAVAWDGGSRLPTRTRFDGILVDAPCTGMGTWHRNPQARWTTRPEDVKELAALQARLLGAASAALKPGGRLVYSVCTLARSETLEVVQRVQEQNPGLESLLIRNPLELEAAASRNLWLRLGRNGGNGMFVAVWTRRG